MTNIAQANLPIFECLASLKAQLQSQNRVVLVAPPGAGKTTYVPLALLEESWLQGRKIIILEPRRLAARSAARYMAAILKEKVGETVGYRVRSDTKVGPDTKIELVTEGVFSRIALSDPELSDVGAVLFDEFHERNLEGDVSLALAIDIQEELREDLRIVPMSATLDGSRVAELLGEAPIVESRGRSFPIDVIYEPRKPDLPIENAVAGTIRSALNRFDGDLLAFVPGATEIRRTIEILNNKIPHDTDLHPLYGGLNHHQQDAAIKPAKPGRRKVVIATSIAETSITIDGVRIVVDSGLARVPRFDPETGLTSLTTERASMSAVNQRKGRAGRTQAGIAIRLWHEGQNGSLLAYPRPEILEADLAAPILTLAAWGVRDATKLKWLDVPPANALRNARNNLVALGALDSRGAITTKGKILQASGNPPNLANMIHVATQYGDKERASQLAELLMERGLGGNSTDISVRLDRYLVGRANRSLANTADLPEFDTVSEDIEDRANSRLSDGALLSLAFPERIAKSRERDGTFQLANGRGAVLGDGENLASAPYLVVAELAGKTSNARILSAASITLTEIELLHGGRIRSYRKVFFDKQRKQVRAYRITALDRIQLSRKPQPLLAEDRGGEVLCQAIHDYGLNLLDWGKETEELLSRARYLQEKLPGQWPDISERWLQSNLDEWLLPFIGESSAIEDIKPALLKQALEARIGYDRLRKLNVAAPSHFDAPSGSRVAIQYRDGQAVLPIRVQEVFGLDQHPVAGNEAIIFELLSPAHRLIQKTSDISIFWKGSWKDVRADMRGRYPKHFWPENPATAQPTSRAKPRKSR